MKKLYEIENIVNQGRAIIFSSTVAIVEVLACHLTADQAAKFKGLIANPDTPFLSVDTRVAELAHEIRSYYAGKVSTPDAIFVATAIHYEAIALHTYDGCGKRKREGDLLGLKQPIAGKYKMPITVPEVPAEPPPELFQSATQLELTEDEPLLDGIVPADDLATETPVPVETAVVTTETKGQEIIEAVTSVMSSPENPQKTGEDQAQNRKG